MYVVGVPGEVSSGTLLSIYKNGGTGGRGNGAMRKFWDNLNITMKLILVFSLVSIVPLLIMSSVLYRISVLSLEKAMEETAAIFSSQITSDMNGVIDDYDALTRSLLVNNDLMDNLDTELPISKRIENQQFYRETVLKMMTMESGMQSVIIMNNKGEYYQYDRYGRSLHYEELLKQNWLILEQEKEGVLFLTALHDCPYYDKNQDQILVTFGRRVYGSDGRYAGMILIDISPSSMIQLSNLFLLERNQYNIKINISDEEGGLIYDSDISSGRIHYSEIDEEELLLYEKNPADYVVIQEETCQLGIQVNTVIPRSSMYLRVDLIRRVTAALAAVLIAVIVAASVLITRRMAYLIRKLQSSMKRLECGSYERIEERTGKDEIGSLVESYNHMVDKMEGLLEEIYQAGIRQKNAQFLALRAQINPHFLFNTLESIRIKAILNGDDEVAEMVKLLARLFRTALDGDGKNYTVEDELENIRAYVYLQNIRFDHVITMEEEIDPKLRGARIPSILFQPVIENSFKYASGESNVPICIHITGTLLEERQMVFTIRDDGQGMTPEKLAAVRASIEQWQNEKAQNGATKKEGSHSIGLRNIAERLRLRYAEAGSLRILSSDASGTTVEIRVPYMQ